MAQKTNTTTEAKAPNFIAWHISQKSDKSYWSRIGACWSHKDGKGMTLQLDTLPTDGRIILRKPNETQDRGAA